MSNADSDIDIIVCKGNNWLQPPEPLLYGSRNTELNQVRWRQEELSMIDLDWEDADWKEYRRQLETVRKNRRNFWEPIKYVVIPDLEDKQQLISILNFAWSLKRRDIMDIAILPVKVKIDLNQLPEWIRPGLPVATGYKEKLMAEMDLSSFNNYTGKIHTLGGTTMKKILQFAYQHAPKAKLGSMDFNSFTHVAHYGKVYTENCTTYDHVPGLNRDEALDKSFKQLLNTLALLRSIPNVSVKQAYELLVGREPTRQLSLEVIF